MTRSIKPGKRIPDQTKRAGKDFISAMQRGHSLAEACKWPESEEAFRSAIALDPKNPEGYLQLGAVLGKSARLEESRDALFKAVKLNGANPIARHNFAQALLLLKSLDEAEKQFRAALSIAPQQNETREALIKLLSRESRVEDALSLIPNRPGKPSETVHYLLAVSDALIEQSKLAEAESIVQRALALAPEDTDALYDLSRIRKAQNLPTEAINLLKGALRLDPTNPRILNTLGWLLFSIGLWEEGEAILRRSVTLNPDIPMGHINLGALLSQRRMFDEAERHTLRALELDPLSNNANCNLGAIYEYSNRQDLAEQYYKKELSIHPDHALAKFNLGCTYLLQGRLEEGWVLQESRWASVTASAKKSFDAPLWEGEDLCGKTLMIHWEQGFGDVIQFIRYALLAREKAGQVIVVVQKALVRLLEGLPGIFVVAKVPEHFDAWCNILSLPRIFNTGINSIPAWDRYLDVPAGAIKRWSRLFHTSHSETPRLPRVGITWAGSLGHTNDLYRSIDFDQLKPILALEGIQWVSLQKDRRPDEMDELIQQEGWMDPTQAAIDFEDTAAIIDQLDLVICVDTAIAHLAGALGKLVWLMLPQMPDWRWLTQFPTSSPWYQSMRIFRQTRNGDWTDVIEQVVDALKIQFSATQRLKSPNVCGVSESAPLPQPLSNASFSLPSSPAGTPETINVPWVKKFWDRYRDCPFWYHRISLPGNLTTPGYMPLNPDAYDLPERLDGLRVLDVGARDGYWTFDALRRGAREVLAIDDFSDSIQLPTSSSHENWQNFDLCREALGWNDSVCKRMTISAYELTEELVGRFDVILLYGVFNQLKHPLLALEKLSAICDGSLRIEAALADEFSAYRPSQKPYRDEHMIMEYYPNAELNCNKSNYWAPTLHTLGRMVQALGFEDVEGWKLDENPRTKFHCRGFVTGYKKNISKDSPLI